MRFAWLAVSVYSLCFSLWSLSLHRHGQTGIFDLGIHCQALWLIGQGLPPFLSTRGTTIFGDHFMPVVYCLWPLQTPESLLIFQTLMLASGALPVYLLARQELACSRSAHYFLLAYLLQPGLWSANLFDFHTSSLATPGFLWALWGLHSQRLGVYWLALLGCLSLGEALGITGALLAGEAYRCRRPQVAGLTLILGLATTCLAYWCMLEANQGQPSQYQSLYHQMQFQPGQWLGYLVLLLLPLAGLPLGGWWRLMPAVPVILGNLLSWREGQRSLDHHYLATILPFLLWAALAGYRVKHHRPWAPWFLGALALVNLLQHSSQLQVLGHPPPPLGLEQVPSVASVAADNAPGAHLSLRQQLYLFPNPWQPLCWGNRPQALVETLGLAGHPPLPGHLARQLQRGGPDYIVLQAEGDSWPLHPNDKAYWLEQLRRHPSYRQLGPGLWRRTAPGSGQLVSSEPRARLSLDGSVSCWQDNKGLVIQRNAGVLGGGAQPPLDPKSAGVLGGGAQPPLDPMSAGVLGGGARRWPHWTADLAPDQPDLHPSGSRILWSSERGGPRQLWHWTLDRGQPEALAESTSSGWPTLALQARPVAGSQGRLLWLGPPHGDWGTVIDAQGQLHCRNHLSGQQFPGCYPVQQGRVLAYARLCDGTYQIFLNSQRLTKSAQDCLEPSLSSDGRWLAYTVLEASGRIRLLDRNTKRLVDLGWGFNPCLSGDGKMVAWTQGQSVVIRANPIR